MRSDSTAGFPGLYCPGLIEGMGKQRYVRLVNLFPGLYCPGLIEGTVRLVMACSYGEGFPGLYCPGLIEGGKLGCHTQRLRPVSGALLPRPH